MSNEATKVVIPEGYWENAQGSLIPISKIKEIDKLRHEFVLERFNDARSLNAQMSKFKAGIFNLVDTFAELSAQEHGVSLGGLKGNISLLSFDGKLRIDRKIGETIAFDESLQAARKLIDECKHEWMDGARDELAAMLNDAFQVDQLGRIRSARILGLRRYDIEDERWQRAMNIISNAVFVSGSKAYVRFYERVGDSNEWKSLSLDMASV